MSTNRRNTTAREVEDEEGSDLNTADDRYVVPALDRGLQLLSLFTRHEPELSRTTIVRRLGLPHATVYRLLHTLEKRGLLRRIRSDYTLGPRILTLGFEYLASQEITELARPHLESLRDDTGGSANLGVLDGREVIYVAHVPPHRPMVMRMTIGARFPAHASSIGRLLLADLPPGALESLYRGVELQKLPEGTPLSLAALKRQASADRERGYVIGRGFYDVGLVAVAAPILDSSGKMIAGVNISGPASSLDVGALDGAIKDRVCLAGRNISELLGYRGSGSGRSAM